MVKMMAMGHIHSLLIDELGGTIAVARLCRVSSPAVSKWRREGIPLARLLYLRVARPREFERWATKFNPDLIHDLAPDVEVAS
jgi:hypothetical protein